MLRFAICFLLTVRAASSAEATATEIARQIQSASLDAAECYRVLDLNFSKEDLRIYLTSGYLIFAKPLNGAPAGAIFTADVEGGDAEVLLLPPVRSERMSLASFTESPNLDEHFQSAVLLFSDRTGEELRAQLRSSGAKAAPEMGALLADRYSPVMRNLASSFEVRLVEDALTPARKEGFFYMSVGGVKLGAFEVMYDPRSPENILVGQISANKGQSYLNVWTSFAGKARRAGEAGSAAADAAVDNYRIEAVLGPTLALTATTRMTVTPREAAGRAMAFSISKQMRVLEAKVDGKQAEVFQHESLRSSMIQANGNEEFLVIAAEPLAAGKPHEFEIRHEGSVISTAGEQVYYVGARGAWYPRHGLGFASYDLTFRLPKELSLVATGEVAEDRVEGNQRVTRRKTRAPIRFAGFNLGLYKSITLTQGPYKVEVFANRKLETALEPKRPVEVPLPMGIRRRGMDAPSALPTPASNPSSRLEILAQDIAGALDYMASLFGPPPVKTLTVSPIPGGFGQGFPGLLYLSTLAYLDPAQRPEAIRDRYHETFFSELLDAHEVAHQWWGNLVAPAGYQDTWLVEALANYSALLFLEKKKGARALDTALEDYKNHLLAKGPSGRTLESAGPITWGYRLESSLAPEAWHFITYEKGAWVMHMLRRRLGQERFLALLRTLCTRYRFRSINTEQFRQLALEFLPPHAPDGDLNSFFENWIYGTGIPAVKLAYTVRPGRIAGTVTLSGVGDDFSARVPLEIQADRQRSLQWVAAGTEAIPFSIPVRGAGAKASVAVHDGLVTVKK